MLKMGRFALRQVEASDLELVLSWRNSERIRSNMYTDHVITIEEHRSWYQRLQGNPSAQYLVFTIDDQPVGMSYFTDIDLRNNKCMWGFYLGQEGAPRGSGTVMGVVSIRYAFEVLKIRKICGEAFQFNTSSTNFFRRLGFSQEGHFVEHVLKGSQYEDIIVFALFRDEWLSVRGELEEKAFDSSRAEGKSQ